MFFYLDFMYRVILILKIQIKEVANDPKQNVFLETIFFNKSNALEKFRKIVLQEC